MNVATAPKITASFIRHSTLSIFKNMTDASEASESLTESSTQIGQAGRDFF
ncbi:hypothetical protein QE109_11565 [Fusibacter bizertensis]|uniref:Uncharacterized protein n=1 Tax=Fusibacter bizertensis TaxID=1488331 RepID=A0ABT6NEF8_9FIRM|nr:hypothetical protein [Fusibacter bizertensis]MDH8678791.1 hypothetical protein [Fusibacter bizertensis]